MLFTSLNFLLIFLPLLFIGYFAVPKRFVAARRYVLMAFSFLFYACGEPIYFFAILLCVFLTWLLSNGTAQRKKLPFLLSLAINLLPLIIFKYLDFLIINVNLIPFINIPLTNLTMPIGISFYTFQMLTYIIDLYGGKVQRQKNFGYLALYIFLFPQLIAGPIVRYADIEEALGQCNENWESIRTGVMRFIKGLAKKMLLANQISYISDTIVAGGLDTITAPMMWLAVSCCAIQIYFDFSGYSDMAIGLGKMFGFDFPENFKMPFSSTSISEFWRRWHISMSTFFRDYIYIPMGGSRVSKGRFILNTLVVWSVTGLWHGAAWNYVLWGLYYGVVLLIEKFFLRSLLEKLPKFICWCYTAFLTVIGFSIFMNDSNSLSRMADFTLRLFGVGEVTDPNTIRILELEAYIPYLVIGLFFCLPIRTWIGKALDRLGSVKAKAIAIPYSIVYDLVYIATLAVCIVFVVGGSYNPFLYFRF
jgi:alginate O-acetyltransferase complex protein AlgI